MNAHWGRPPLSHDCHAGEHDDCDGLAWDDVDALFVLCGCFCHDQEG